MSNRKSGGTLAAADEALARLLDAAPDAMAIVDGDDQVRFVNARWQALFGYRGGELVGNRITSVLGEGAVGPIPSGLASEGRWRTDRAEMIGLRKDGAWLPVDVSTMPLDTPSGSMRVLIARDMTERWQAADQLQQAQELDRKRMADGIHDDSIQSITAASLRLQQLRRGRHEPAELEVLSAIEELLEMTSVGLRRLMFELHTPALFGLGLATAIRELLELMRATYGVSSQVRHRILHEPAFPRRIALYRIAEEALRAACAAARPTEVIVEIDDHNHGFLLTLCHDGTGAGSEDFTAAADCARIEVRARLGGGWVQFDRVAGGLARASIWIPADATSALAQEASLAVKEAAA